MLDDHLRSSVTIGVQVTATERRRKPELFLWEGHVDLGEGKREGGRKRRTLDQSSLPDRVATAAALD